MSLSIPIQAPCRQICRSQPRRLKEAIPLIGTTTTTATEQNYEEINTSSHHRGRHADGKATCENDYVPPSTLQQQIQSLEQMLQQDDWMKLSERGDGDGIHRTNDDGNYWNDSGHDDPARIASRMTDMDTDDEDELESMESIQSLKEELRWAESQLLGPFLSKEANKKSEELEDIYSPNLAIEATNSHDRECYEISDCESDQSSGKEETLSSSEDKEASTHPKQDIGISSTLQTCNAKTIECNQQDAVSSLNQSKQDEDENGDLSLIKSFRRTESLLVVSSALFAVSLLLGDNRRKTGTT